MTSDQLTVVVGGAVFDGARHRPRSAVVLRGDRVVDVVERAAVADLPGRPRVVDVGDGLVAPGFVDAHVHAVQGGVERIRCDLTGDREIGDYLASVRAFLDRTPDAPWVLGGGWSIGSFHGGWPTASLLDEVAGDRPVFLLNRDHHSAWVSSAALRLAGVDADTPDPRDGHVERDASGRPTGTLHEGAMRLVDRHVPPTSDEELDRGLLAAQDYLHSLGVTGWQDAIVGEYAGGTDPGPAYRRAGERGDLTAAVVGALWWDRERGPEQVADLVARREALAAGRFRATSVKIMADGVAENFTASMLAPYLDRCGHLTENHGRPFVDHAALVEAVVACESAGFQVHVHAIGDRAVRDALDAFDAARGRRTGPDPDLRHHIAHVQFVAPDDRPRFGALGVAANVQTLWARNDVQMREHTLPYVDEERAGWQYPFGSLAAAGARLVAGSDWPVSTPDPLAAMHVAVNRREWGAAGEAAEPFLPHEAVGLDAAFAAYTAGSAWVCHRDDGGRLAPGSAADLVVLDRDPFAGPVEEIAAANCAATWVGGLPVYEA